MYHAAGNVCVNVCGQRRSLPASSVCISTRFAHGHGKGKILKIFNQCIAQVCGELLRKEMTKWVSPTGMFLQLSVPSFPPVVF